MFANGLLTGHHTAILLLPVLEFEIGTSYDAPSFGLLGPHAHEPQMMRPAGTFISAFAGCNRSRAMIPSSGASQRG